MAMLSIWGIILVVMGHSGFTNNQVSDNLPNLHKWIYSFHMPLFFCISGYLFSLTNKSLSDINPGPFILKKLKRLMVPYFVLGVIIFFIKYLFSGLASVDRTFSVSSFLYMFLAPSTTNSTMGFLWYLITLFGIFCIALILSKMRINLHNVTICIVCVIISYLLYTNFPKIELFNISAIIHYIPFFIIGICSQSYHIEDIIEKANINKLVINVLIGGGIQTALLFIDAFHVSSGISYYLVACCGIWFSICLCQLILLSASLRRLLLPFAPMVYSIYLLSWFGQYPIQIITLNILHLNWFLSFMLIFIGGILFPVCVYALCKKIKRYKFYNLISLAIGL